MLGYKTYTYAVLAITIGYLLISGVPSQLTFMQHEKFEARHQGEPIIEDETRQEESSISSEPEILGDTASSAKAATDAAKAAAEDAKTTASGLNIVSEAFTGFGSLMISLLIAFGVYLVARRRFI